MDWHHPLQSVLLFAVRTSTWAWVKSLPDGWKVALTIGGVFATGLGLGGGIMLVRQDRARFAESTIHVDALQEAFDSHVRASEAVGDNLLGRMTTVEQRGQILQQILLQLRSDSARLDRIECYVEAMAGNLGRSSLTACGVRGRR